VLSALATTLIQSQALPPESEKRVDLLTVRQDPMEYRLRLGLNDFIMEAPKQLEPQEPMQTSETTVHKTTFKPIALQPQSPAVELQPESARTRLGSIASALINHNAVFQTLVKLRMAQRRRPAWAGLRRELLT
jgi:hypothetical protein